MGRKKKIWGQKKAGKPKRIIKEPGSRTKEPLTQEEQERILKAARETGDFEYKTILIFLDTGMHPCVLAGDCKDTNPELMIWDEEFIRWTRPKNQEAMQIIIPKRLKEWIGEYLEKDRPRYRQYYNRIIKAIGEKAGIKGLSPLSLRHTFAINRLNDGYDIGDLRKFMGTRDLRSLEHYLEKSREYMKKRIKGKEW